MNENRSDSFLILLIKFSTMCVLNCMCFEKPNNYFSAFTMFAPMLLLIATTFCFSTPHPSKHSDISVDMYLSECS